MPRPNAGPRLKPHPKSKIYEIHWTDDGRSRRESTRTRDAEKAAVAFRDWRQDVERDKAAAEAATVRGLLEAYWTEHVEENCASKDGSLKSQKAALLAHFADMHPAEITPADVRAYIRKRRAGEIGGRAKGGANRGVQNPTVRRDLTMLVAALNHAVDEGRMKRGDVPAIPLPPENAARVRWLKEDELARLFAAAAGISAERGRMCRIERWLFLAYYTARRKKAIEQAAWDRVDFELNTVDFDPPGRRKTKKRRGSTKMHPKLRAALERAHAERKPGDAPGTFSPWVLDHDGDLKAAFRVLRRRAGFGPDVTIHVLKHTSITHMLRRGKTTWEVLRARPTRAKRRSAASTATTHRTRSRRLGRRSAKDPTRNKRFKVAAGWVRWCSSTRRGTGHVRWQGRPSRRR